MNYQDIVYPEFLDNLTHTLTGLMLARATVPASVPRAGLLMMLAANMPDCDVWSFFAGTATYLEYHRGSTHALFYSPLLAFVPVAIVWLLETRRPERRSVPWALMWLFSWIAVLSHLALDWTNIYGIRMLLPFSGEWLRLDSVNVVDPLIWTILALGVLAPALSRLVSSEIGARPSRGTGWAIFALLTLFAYEGARYVLHDRAVLALNSRIYDGSNPLRVAAFATTANPFSWKGLVETQATYIVYGLNLLEPFDPAAGRTFYKAQPAPAIQAASKTRDFKALLDFTSFPIWRVTPEVNPEGSFRVELFDLRFGTPASPGLAASAVVEPSGAVRSTAVGFGRLQPK